jgi:hypothetical protein
MYSFGTFVTQENLKADFSNLHSVLENYVRCGYTAGEIIELISQESNGNISKEVVCSMLEQLESQFGLYYIKYLS